MTVEKMDEMARELADHSLETVDLKTLEVLYYDNVLAYYMDFSEEELIEEFKDRELEID